MTPDSAKAKTVAPFRVKPGAGTAVRDDATFEFASESKPESGELAVTPASVPSAPIAGAAPHPAPEFSIRRPAVLVAVFLGTLLLVAGAVWAALTLRIPAPATGSLNVESDPAGAEVRIDDTLRGTTPLALTLPEGRHTMVVQRGSNTKQLAIDITQGTSKAYHIEWAETPAAAPTDTGSLSVVSDAPGSLVIVDGTERGQTPLTIRDLTAGRHDVLVRNANTTYQRSVQVESGATASLVVGGTSTATPSWGWISVDAPFTLQVLESGRVVGTSEIERIMLSPGNHQLDFVSDTFGFRQSQRVTIAAGRGGPVSLTIPRVSVNINALPWAEVYVDGAKIGDTPLANVMQPLGDHELVFRHPQLGEKRQVTRVTLKDSLRVSVDMRSK